MKGKIKKKKDLTAGGGKRVVVEKKKSIKKIDKFYRKLKYRAPVPETEEVVVLLPKSEFSKAVDRY